jgi:hydroxyacylglutathione hydrolase
MKPTVVLLAFVFATPLLAAPVAGDLGVTWNAGAEDCAKEPGPPLQIHRYEPQTIILRQSLCTDFEAPLIYLLIGARRALLIDSGAVTDAKAMPLTEAVTNLLPLVDGARLPLLVVHTHGHGDHRAGDAQFAALPGTEVVPAEAAGLHKYFGFDRWPEGHAQIDLGDRVIDVLPVPGHQSEHVLFYDSRTAILFSGDFLLPGRLLVDDIDAYRVSAQRAVDFLQDKPVTHVLGAHIELAANGELFPSGSTFHPNERALALTKADLESLPNALADFNGFYSSYPNFTVVNPVRNLLVLAAGVLIALTLLVWLVRRLWKARRISGTAPAG